MDARIEVVLDDGSSESYLLEGEQSVLGRALTANIAIPDARDLEPEHFLLKPQFDGCWVGVAQGARTPTLVAGKPFESGLLPWGTEIQVGEMVIVLTGDDPTKGRDNVAKWAIGVAVLGILFGFYVYKTTQDSIGNLTVPQDFPNITPAAVECRLQGEGARFRAREAMEAALAKSDRYPFDPQDGIEAIRLYTEAASCAKLVGEAAMVRRAVDLGKRMNDKVQDDYRTHRLALQLAIDGQNIEDAFQRVNILYGLVQHKEGPYKQWLRETHSRLSIAIAKEKGK
ncbi:MAG: hypothetical protein KC416_06885 [Myxococcales bacterium]|nr:hypothetical protein [Myxococcales bacterium]